MQRGQQPGVDVAFTQVIVEEFGGGEFTLCQQFQVAAVVKGTGGQQTYQTEIPTYDILTNGFVLRRLKQVTGILLIVFFELQNLGFCLCLAAGQQMITHLHQRIGGATQC